MKKQINKVLLLSPPVLASKDRMDINPYPPLGLGYIAATLKQMDIEVKIVDCFMEGRNTKVEWDEDNYMVGLGLPDIEHHIRKFQPDMVGITQMFSRQTAIVDGIFQMIKTHPFHEIRNVITVIGGAHPSVLPEYCARNPKINFVIMGEGEKAFTDLVKTYNVEGINVNTTSYIGAVSIQDLDSIPFPDWEVMNLPKYFGSKASHGYRKKKRFCPVITSRGCPIGCTFCTAHCVWGKKYRKRSVENVLLELAALRNQYDIQEIMFEDDNLTLDKKRAKELFSHMRGMNLVWDTPNGISPWTLDEEMLDLMKASGCYRVNMAVESASPEMLVQMHKPLNIPYTKKMIRYAQSINLDVGIFLVIGMPHETELQRQNSYDFCKEMGVYFPHISIATPYPGSDLYRQLYSEKHIVDNGFLESLHIRNKLVSQEVQESLKKAEKEFLTEAIKYTPLQVIKSFIRVLITNPFKTARRLCGFLRK